MNIKRFIRLIRMSYWMSRSKEKTCAEFLRTATSAYHGVPYTTLSGTFYVDNGQIFKNTHRSVMVSCVEGK
jgi:hypothetical protein